MAWRKYIDPNTGREAWTDAPEGYEGDPSGYTFYSPQPGDVMPGSDPAQNNNSEWYNPALQNAAYQAGQLAAQQKRLELIDVPMLELQKQQAIMQAAQAAVNGVLQANLGAGNMALTAGNMGLSAAQLASQEGLGALGIAAGLRGPRNAFQQQESMHGLNAAGLSNAVGAIAGKYTLPGFKAPQAAPQGATLGTMAEDFQGAGGYGSTMAPSDYARMYADRAYQDAQRYGQGGINAAQDFYGRYGPNAQGATSGGVYNTVMGQRTVAQMRQELKNAGFPEWQSADDNTIVAKYGSTARSADGRQGMPTPVAQAQQPGGQQMPGTGGIRQGVGGGQPGMGQYGENYGSPYGMASSGPLQQPGTYQPRPITDIDRAYNDAYAKQQAAQTGQSDMMFRYAPPGWQPGMPLPPSPPMRGQPGTGQGGWNYSQSLMAANAGGVANQQQAGQPGYKPSYSTSAAEYAKALPTPNKISGKAWLGLDQDSRDFLTSAYESPELGYSANYVNDQIRRGLPGFRAPSVGRVA